MPIVVPVELAPILAAADRSTGAIDELGLAAQLLTALGKDRQLTEDERKGAFAEIEAWRFQRSREDGRRTWGIYWTELTSRSTKDGSIVQYFPDVASATEDVVAHWIRRSEDATHPTIRARFADLAWEIGRHNRVGRTTQDLARRAIDAYLQAVERGLFNDEINAWLWLDRAAELATTIKDESRFLAARDAAFTTFRSLAAAGKATALSHWRFDDIVWTHHLVPLAQWERAEVVDALERELQVRSDISNPAMFDPHAATDMADRLQRWRQQVGEKDDANRAVLQAGQAFEQVSSKASGLLAVSWLEDVLSRYRNAGLRADAARVEQSIRLRSNDAASEMKVASVPISIPADELERWADQVAGSDTSEALSRIAMIGLRKEAATRESVEGMLNDSALLAHIPITLAGPRGFTEAKVGSLKDDPDGHAFLHASRLFGWHSSFLNLAFRRAREKHGMTIEQIIAHARMCPFFPEDRMPLLQKGVEAWLADDFVSAVHILVPQVEAALRDCLAAVGGVTVKPNRNGGFHAITLGDILTDPIFASSVPADLRFHLRALYTDARGLNLRNHVAHGLMHPSGFQRGIGNLVMHSVLLIAALRPSEPKPDESNVAEP